MDRFDDTSAAIRPHAGRRSRILITLSFAVIVWRGCTGAPPNLGQESLVVEVVLLTSGLISPLGIADPNDGSGRLFINEQSGQIRILDSDGRLLDEPFLDIADRMVSLDPFDERGLLSMTCHPDFASNGRFYLLYIAPRDEDDPEDFDSEIRVSEFRIPADDPNRADLESERILLDINNPAWTHNGGVVAFGPDGFLYISIGDGGCCRDQGLGHTPGLGNGQDKSTLLGKILRIDVDSGSPYAIPPDNPFAGDLDARPEIWALGMRNPYRFSFDQNGDRRLLVADVGENLFEEVSLVERGGNYGWNIKEGSSCFNPQQPTAPLDDCAGVDAEGRPLIDPIIEYPHFTDDGRLIGVSVIGGFVYRGSAIPALDGLYIFGELSASFLQGDGSLFAAEEHADRSWRILDIELANIPNGRLGAFILSFGQDASGEMYVLTRNSLQLAGAIAELYKFVPAAP